MSDRRWHGLARNASTLFEIELALSRFNAPAAMRLFEEWRNGPLVELVPFDARLFTISVEAHRNFGRARHKANLNFGDCMSYAVAKHFDVPLLYKGDDFTLTDIRSALP